MIEEASFARAARLAASVLILAATPLGTAAAQEQQPAEEASIVSERIPLANGELILKQTVIIDASVSETWAYFTDEEYISRWMAPVAAADLRTGGSIRTNYNSCASIGDEGTIDLQIRNFIPESLLTLQSSLESARDAEWMNDAIYEQRDHLYNVIQFEPLSEDQTRITSWGLGYRQDQEWETMLGFFIAGNEWSYQQLQKAVRGEQVWPPCAD